MHPEASRIVNRIRTALKGRSGGLETAKLAWQLASAIEKANKRLDTCSDLLAADDQTEAFLLAHSKPNLLETVEALNCFELQEWSTFCQERQIKAPLALQTEKAEKIKANFDSIDKPKDWLYAEYRKRLRSKNQLHAYQVINTLAMLFADDPNIQEESHRLETAVKQAASEELFTALQELMPQEAAISILERYRAEGFEFSESKPPFKNAAEAELQALASVGARMVETVIAEPDAGIHREDWQSAEIAYLECDFYLASTKTRSEIDPSLRSQLEGLATTLDRARRSRESILRIRKAIATLNGITSGKTKGSKERINRRSLTLKSASERLRSAASQAKKLGYRVPEDLQKEIAKALNDAKIKRLPRILLLATAASISILCAFWAINAFVDHHSENGNRDEALLAIRKARDNGGYTVAQIAIQNWAITAETADADTELAIETNTLRQWLADQDRLAAGYQNIADRMHQLKLDGYHSGIENQVDHLLQAAEDTRDALAFDLGSDGDRTIDTFKDWLLESEVAETSSQREAFSMAMLKAQTLLDQASLARSPEEFGEIAKQANQAIAETNQLLDPIRGESTDGAAAIARYINSLSELSNKWNVLSASIGKLGDATDFNSYIAELERIHSFDILPASKKSAIERVLSFKQQYAAAKQRLVMPSDTAGWLEFAESEDYRRDNPELGEVERIFLERLANDTFFGSIYVSKVKYFEGEPVAKSEYETYLIDPVSKNETTLKTGKNFSFMVRGFDERGDPEERPREMNFLSHPDGTFWGFFYEPSTVASETKYYEETIRPRLLQILAGSQRFTLIDLFQNLNQARQISPAFRAYWQEQILTFMEMNPWKWGLPLSPSLQEQARELARISRGGFPKRQWRSSIEQSAPSFELVEYFRNAEENKIVDEAQAFATIYQYSIQGDFEMIGFIDEDGNTQLSNTAGSSNDLWTINQFTGRFQRMSADEEPIPYAPIFKYMFEGKPTDYILQKTFFLTGFNAKKPGYSKFLPPLFQR